MRENFGVVLARACNAARENRVHCTEGRPCSSCVPDLPIHTTRRVLTMPIPEETWFRGREPTVSCAGGRPDTCHTMGLMPMGGMEHPAQDGPLVSRVCESCIPRSAVDVCNLPVWSSVEKRKKSRTKLVRARPVHNLAVHLGSFPFCSDLF